MAPAGLSWPSVSASIAPPKWCVTCSSGTELSYAVVTREAHSGAGARAAQGRLLDYANQQIGVSRSQFSTPPVDVAAVASDF